MLFWPRSSGCCCDEGEPDPCAAVFWDVQFQGCYTHDYEGGGTCELRRFGDGVVLATATIGPTGYASGTVALSPAPANANDPKEVTLHWFPADARFQSGSRAFNMTCTAPHGFIQTTAFGNFPYDIPVPIQILPVTATDPFFLCCADLEWRPIPSKVTLTDDAGTTTLAQTGFGLTYTGTATLSVPAGRQTFGGCVATRADITIGIIYRWSCNSGQLIRNVTSCGNFLDPSVASLRDKDDHDDLSHAATEDTPVQSPATHSTQPVSSTYAAFSFRGASFGTTSVVE